MPENETISVVLTGEQVRALRSAVDRGEYATTGDILREAVGEWQRGRESADEELARLRRLWQVGEASGTAVEIDLDEVRAEARKRLAKVAGETA